MDIVSVFGPPTAVFFGAGGIGFLLGYAVKKIAKILAVIVGLFFIGLAYLDYQGRVHIPSSRGCINVTKS
ncbi:MAG: FUN14 domain-containing protein [Thermoproteota archaeon]|nr:FUN14 domain-containing protein [Thermoproteota archaeon]